MSILGIGSLKLETAGGVVYTISYTYNRKFDYQDEDLEHKSDIDGERIFDEKGDHATFSFHVNLYKNDSARDALSVLRELYKTEVYIYPYNSYSIKDTEGDKVPFFFKKMFIYQMDTSDFKDRVFCELLSTEYVDIFASSSEDLQWPEGDGMLWPEGDEVQV